MSSKRLTPKEIKRDIRHDELQSLLAETVDQARSHSRQIVLGVVAVLVLAIVAAGAYAYLGSRKAGADEALSAAMRIYSAPVVEEGARPDDPERPTFGSEEAKRERTRAAFEEVQGGLGSSVAGDVAGLYLAEMALEEGDTARARELWEGFLDEHEDNVLAYSVRINLIHLDREEGKAEEVAERLTAELEASEKSLPEDVILFELAKTLDQLERREEAAEHYQRLVDEYPRSAYTLEANRRLAEAG